MCTWSLLTPPLPPVSLSCTQTHSHLRTPCSHSLQLSHTLSTSNVLQVSYQISTLSDHGIYSCCTHQLSLITGAFYKQFPTSLNSVIWNYCLGKCFRHVSDLLKSSSCCRSRSDKDCFHHLTLALHLSLCCESDVQESIFMSLIFRFLLMVSLNRRRGRPLFL